MMVGQRKSEKEKIDRRLHNTDLLLRNYRTLKASYENAVYKSKEGEVTEVLEDIMTMKDDKVIVESIKTSAKRTAIMVQHIDKMLMDDGKTVEEISKQLGMRPEEIFRLSDFSKEDFLKMMTKGVTGYSKAEFITKI